VGEAEREDPGPSSPPQVGPKEVADAPAWVRLLVPVTGLLVIAGFAIAAPAHLGYSSAESGSSEDCGSALSPVLQSSGSVGGCNEALLGPRIVAATLAGLAAVGAFLGVRHSRSVGRTHNQERDMCLVVASVAVFLLVWVSLAYLTAQLLTYEPS
jgi:hypothetical protein